MSLGETGPDSFHAMAADIAHKHRGIDYAAAASALETALWDLRGQAAGKPLAALLGGDIARAIPVYANTWSGTCPDTETLAARVHRLVDQGYDAVKFYPIQNRTADEAGRCMGAIRGAVGNGIALMLDLSCPDEPGLAAATADAVRPFDPYWFEEPIDGDDVAGLAEIRKTTGLRIVTGEKQCGIPHFRNVIRARAADILNPDIAGVGGIIEMMEIARMADTSGIAVSPHCWNSMTVAAAAMLHVCAAIPNAEMAEIYPNFMPFGETFADPGFTLKQGKAQLSGAPGLGVRIDPQRLSEVADQTTTE